MLTNDYSSAETAFEQVTWSHLLKIFSTGFNSPANFKSAGKPF